MRFQLSNSAILGVALLITVGCQQQRPPADPSASLANPETPTAPDGKPAPAKPAPPAAMSDVVAHVNGQPITMGQLQAPLVEAHGLSMLLYLGQLELARQKCAAAKLAVTDQDIEKERQITLDQLFKNSVDTDKLKLPEKEKEEFRRKEYARLLKQFLDMQRLSAAEFDLAMQSGAYLRKLAATNLGTTITEEHLQEAFRIEYGEKVRVRHIQLSNLREVAEARRRLDAGEAFEKVAREMSRDANSRAFGGELRPFSRAERFWPAEFSKAAFELKDPGDISDPVHSGEAYHLIRLEERIMPKAVRYEDHKEFLREKLYTLTLQVRLKQLREELAAEAQKAMRIENPILRRQYQERLDRISGVTSPDAAQVRREIELDRTPTTTRGSASHGHEVARPPASRPGK